MNEQIINFGTSNVHKLKEAKQIFEDTNFKIEHFPVDLLEIQDFNVEKIALFSLDNIPLKTDNPIFVEDTGLFIDSLNGFPGAFAAFIFKTIGNEGILKLMKEELNRNAYFESCIAFRDKKGRKTTFVARCEGYIANEIQGEMWGFDPIFCPKSFELNPENKNFSQLGEEVKNKLSHRLKALEKLKIYLLTKEYDI